MPKRVELIITIALVLIIVLLVLFKTSISESIGVVLLISMYIIFIGFLIFLFVNFKKIFCKIQKKTVLILAIIIICSLVIKLFIFPQFLGVYMDEVMRVDAANNIALTDKAIICEPGFNKEFCGDIFVPIGWPFLMSLPIKIGFFSNSALIDYSIMIGVLNILLIFFLVRLIFKNENIALLAAFIFAFDKLNLAWSISGNDLNASIFFLLISTIAFFLFMKEQNLKSGLLFAFSFIFMIYIRTELLLIIIPFAAIFFAKRISFKQNFKIPILIILIFLIILLLFMPTLTQTQKNFRHGDMTEELSTKETFLLQSKDIIYRLVDGTYYSIFYIIIFAVGIIGMYSKFKKELLFLLTWLILFFIVYNVSNIKFIHKYYLVMFIPLIIIISYGFIYIYNYKSGSLKRNNWKVIRRICTALVIILICSNVLPAFQESQNNRILLAKLPHLLENDIGECYLLSGEAILFSSITNIKAITASDFAAREGEIINSLRGQCLLFFDDFYCDRGKGCDYIKDNYNPQPYLEYKNTREKYIIYKLEI